MITVKDGNLFDAPKGIICHQVNCKGVMGAGVAKQFKEQFPYHYKLYKQTCMKAINPSDLLGKIIFLGENDQIYSCSMFAQINYGREEKHTYTDYNAFQDCCKTIASTVNAISSSHKTPINIPYKIGCGLANGDWHIIYSIIDEVFKDYNVILWRLNK